MRVSIETPELNIEGEVIAGEPVNDTGDEFDLDCEFTIRCDDGEHFIIYGWMVEAIVMGKSDKLSQGTIA